MLDPAVQFGHRPLADHGPEPFHQDADVSQVGHARRDGGDSRSQPEVDTWRPKRMRQALHKLLSDGGGTLDAVVIEDPDQLQADAEGQQVGADHAGTDECLTAEDPIWRQRSLGMLSALREPDPRQGVPGHTL